MEDAHRVRRVTRAAVDDVSPPELRSVIDGQLAAGSVVPGVLAVASARLGGGADAAAVDRRAAGVQLIYEGLRRTRRLVREEPWGSEAGDDADVAVVAADVMVARGFRLLARTDAAPQAVDTVRAFGRAETERRDTDDAARDLEADVFELAVVAGASVDGGEAPRPLRQYAVGLARASEGRPLGPVEAVLPDRVEEVMRRVAEEPSAGRSQPPRLQSGGSVNRND